MFRRTLLVFLGLVLLVLAITLGYALLGLSGPESTVAAARAEAAGGDHAAAIRLADIAERSLGPDPDPALHAQLLDIRSASYLAVGNYRPALRDLARLRTWRPDDLDLARSEIRWTIVAGDAQRALDLAKGFLERTPDDAPVLELSGEACQAQYRAELRDLLSMVGAQLDPANAEKAFEAIRSWIYRDRRDPVANLALGRFEQILKVARPDLAASGEYVAKLRQIRERIRQTLQFFARALAADGQPVAAYTGTAYALRQAGRFDDLQWLAEIYLHRFEHVYSMLAAVDLAELHLSKGRFDAVLEVRARALPEGSWKQRLDEGRLDHTVAGLLLAQARALEGLGRVTELRGLVAEAREIDADPRIALAPELEWIEAIGARADGRWSDAMSALGDYDRALAQLPQGPDVVERRIRVMNERLAIARERNYRPEFFESTYRTLARLDARDPRPVLEQTRFRIEQQDPIGALMLLRSARRVAEHDEEVLHVRAAALDAKLEGSGRGSAAQLARCLELGVDIPPDVRDELLMPLAEKALEAGHPTIALACAREATELFNWARWPRRLLIRAAFASGDADTARRAAENLLLYHPGDIDALLDLRRARTALGLPSEDVVYDLLVAHRDDAESARALVEAALRRDDLQLANHLARTIELHHRDSARALLAAAGVYERIGELTRARETLQRAGEVAIQPDPQTFRDVYERYVVLTAQTVENAAEVQLVVQQFLALSAGDGAAMLRLAARLHELGLDRYALLMIDPVLDDPSHPELRTGPNFLLGARVAMACGLDDKARRHVLSALTFPESEAAASRMFALMNLDAGRTTEIADDYWETQVTDATSAALFTYVDRPGRALPWVRGRLASAPADVAAMTLLAILAPTDTLPAPFRALAAGNRNAVLELLALLDVDGFELAAARRAVELVRASDRNPIARVLRARANAALGRVAEALRELDDVIREQPLLISAYEEAVRILESDEARATPDPELVGRLTDAQVLQSGLATPMLIAFATDRRAAGLLARLGEDSAAADELAALWLRSPGDGEADLDRIALLSAAKRPDLALVLCDALLPRLRAELRGRFCALYFPLVRAQLAGEPDRAAAATDLARLTLERDGAFGSAVRFLWEQDVAANGALGERREPARVAALGALLDAHLRFVRAGKENDQAALLWTLRRTAELRGRQVAIEAATERLRADPSLVDVWVQRAHWLAQEGDPERAVDGLRWLHLFVPTHPATLECVELSAREGVIHEDDLRAIDERIVDRSLLETPDALLTRGLIALRRADYETAYDRLSRGAPRPDGAHLYYRGLALMPLGRADEARAVLEQCAREYPDSPLTTLAEEFARQLAR